MRKLLLSDRNLQQVDFYSVVGMICINIVRLFRCGMSGLGAVWEQTQVNNWV